MSLSHALESYTESPEDPCGEVGADGPLRFQCWSTGLQRLTRVRNTETVSRKYIEGSKKGRSLLIRRGLEHTGPEDCKQTRKAYLNVEQVANLTILFSRRIY